MKNQFEIKGIEKFFVSDYERREVDGPFGIRLYGVDVIKGVFPPIIEDMVEDIFIDMYDGEVIGYNRGVKIYIGVIDNICLSRKFNS